MANDFNWQIDDASTPPTSSPTSPPPPPRRISRRLALIVLSILTLTITAGVFWLSARARDEQEAQRIAILHVAQLEDDLITRGDFDALATLLDPNLPDWISWEQAYERALTFRTIRTRPTTYGPVTLNDDHAQLDVTRQYYLSGYATNTQPISVTRTQHYRWIDGGWLHTAPPSADTDPTTLSTSYYLTIRYPLHDEAILQPLLPRLHALAARTCLDLPCPTKQTALVISANPRELQMFNAIDPAYVPAPLLTGTPADPEALYQEYGRGLVTSIALAAAAARPAVSGQEPPEHFAAWSGWLLTRLDLTAEPNADAIRAAAGQAFVEGRSPLTAVDHIQQELGVRLALDFLAQTDASPLKTILSTATRDGVLAELEQATRLHADAWWIYLERRAGLTQTFASGAQLTLACPDGLALWNISADLVRPLGLGPGVPLWAPNGRRLSVSTDADTIHVLDLDSGGSWDAQQTALAWAPDSATLAIRQGETRAYWRLTATPEFLPLTPDTGWLAWSPTNALAYATEAGQIVLSAPDSPTPTAIGPGDWGTWSPSGRYLLFTQQRTHAPAVNVYDTRTHSVSTVLTRTQGILYDMDWQAGNLDTGNFALTMRSTGAHDAFGSIWVLALNGQVEHAWITEDIPIRVAWSPRGTRLAWGVVNSEGKGEVGLATILPGVPTAELPLITVLPPDARDIHLIGWSPDGAWLAVQTEHGAAVRAVDSETWKFNPCAAQTWRPSIAPLP